MFFELEKAARRAAELGERRWRTAARIERFRAQEAGADGVHTDCPERVDGAELALGAEFNGRDRYQWLEQEVAVPQAADGCQVMGYFDFGQTGGGGNSGFEAMLYVDGVPYQGVDTNHRDVPLGAFAGRTVRLTFLLWSGLEGGGPVRTQYHRLLDARVGLRDEKLDRLYYLLTNLTESLRYLAPDSEEQAVLPGILDRTLALLDWDEENLAQTGAQALAYLEKALKELPGHHPATVYAVGHTHIDVSWLWRLKHTREKAQRSFATVLRLMEEYPEYRFLQTQPQLYRFLQKDSPALYAQIKERVREGRWEADGGMWLEADCNVTSGESLARQFLYGIRFIEQEFGKKCSFLWLPDVFGYSWALPQIMKLCGLKTFMTTKISWNQYNTVPNDLFWWRGIDGTEMLTYFVDVPAPGMAVDGRGSTYNGEITAETILGTWRKFKNKELSRETLISYGYGDGGGGTTRGMIENIRAINQIPGMPTVKPATAREFFDRIHENVAQTDRYVPLWDGELYLEYHRGTYTSQARNKWHNRKLENALGQIEWLASLAELAGGTYPAAALHDCWETVLRDQFHDVIPGSSIREVYKDTEKEYAAVWETLESLEREARRSLLDGADNDAAQETESGGNGGMAAVSELGEMSASAGQANGGNGGTAAVSEQRETYYSAARFADVSGAELLRLPEERDGVFADESGNALPAQRVEGGYLVEKALEPLEIGTIRFVPGKAGGEQAGKTAAPAQAGADDGVRHAATAPGGSGAGRGADGTFTVDIAGRMLETPHYIIRWEESGALTSLWDKENGREALRGKGNVLRVYEDKPLNFDAWDVDIFYTQKWEDMAAQEITCTECGALRAKIRFVYRYRHSLIEQELIVYANSRRIDFATYADWHESHRLLKTLFEVDIRATKATYDIQFGQVERPTHWNTSWDWARFEVCGHKWADLSESDYGVSLLNDCKYGYGIKDNVMGLSLLKSAKYPDTEADMGEHRFTYALLPHAGALGRQTREQGLLLNQPALCLRGRNAAGVGRLVTKDCRTVQLDAVKKAEDGDGYVIHLHECAGGRARVKIASDYGIKAYAPCNLLEEYEEKQSGSAFEAAFGPFEIKCYRIWL